MKTIASITFLLFAATPLFAQNWTGNVSADWNDPANWSAAPANGDDISIDPANYTGIMAQPVIIGTSNFTPAEMLIQNGGQLIIDGTLNASDRVEVTGAGSSLTVNNGIVALTGAGNNARLIFSDNAHFLLADGSLDVGQRLLFETGATGNVNNGTISVGETIAIGDGNAIGSSRLTQTGGTITTEAFTFENELGNYSPTFTQSAGELYVNGDLTWLGEAPGAGKGVFKIVNDGIVHIGGSVINDPTSTMNMLMDMGNGARIYYDGSYVRTSPGDTIRFSWVSSWVESGTVTWLNDGVLNFGNSTYYQAGITTLTGTGKYQFDKVQLLNNKQLNIVSPSFINISGSIFIANNNLQTNSNKVVLNGAELQLIVTNGAPAELYDLDINNTFPGTQNYGHCVEINGDIRVLHQLKLLSGKIRIVEPHVFTLVDDATVIGGAATRFFEGYMVKEGNDAVSLPVGKCPDLYRPFSFLAPVSASTVVKVVYRNDAHSPVFPVESSLYAISQIEYWDISRTGSNDEITPGVGWNNGMQSGLTNCQDIALAAWDGTLWNVIPAVAAGQCDYNNAGTLNALQPMPVIGPLAIGFTTPVHQNVVSLCSSTEYLVGQNVLTEDGVYIFTLTDMNGNDSISVTILSFPVWLPATIADHVTYLQVEPAGGVNGVQWLDCNDNFAAIPSAMGAIVFEPPGNGSYAAVVSHIGCTDTDTSECIVIDQLGLVEAEELSLLLYPNPVKAGQKLQLTGAQSGDMLTILTMDGRTIRFPEPLNSGETTVLSIEGLSAGTYQLLIEKANGGHQLRRFTVME